MITTELIQNTKDNTGWLHVSKRHSRAAIIKAAADLQDWKLIKISTHSQSGPWLLLFERKETQPGA